MSELSSHDLFRVNEIGDRFESSWRRGGQPRIEDYLANHQGSFRKLLMSHLIGIEVELMRRDGKAPGQPSYECRFPGDLDVVAAIFAEEQEHDPSALHARY